MGDVDVLVVNPRKRLITAIETKDVEIARIPPELANEIGKLLAGKDSAVHKHMARLEWLKIHVPEILRSFDIPQDEGSVERARARRGEPRSEIAPLAKESHAHR